MSYNKVSLAASPVLFALMWQFRSEPLAVCTCISLLAGLTTWCIIPLTVPSFKRVGLSGVDMAKPSRPLLAESMGVLAATIYLIATFLFIPAQFSALWSADLQTLANTRLFPFDRLGMYLSALLSLQSMVFLGFADDVFDLRWRFKLFLPTIASIPVLTVYYVGYGVTHVMVPVFLRDILGTKTVELGVLYYVYIGLMAVFCTNAINILAGINGVEVGQSIVIALSIIAKDIANINNSNLEAQQNHMFSLYLLLPFVSVSTALYYWNVYPARVFVGDTYCYFAGMTFAVCGIHGHFSKTLLLLFVPQAFNFVYSAPQIFGFVPCPRHRLPKMVVNSPMPRKLINRLQKEFDTDALSGAGSDDGYVGTNSDSDTPAPTPSIREPGAVHRTLSSAMMSFAKGKLAGSRKTGKASRSRAGSAAEAASSQAAGSTYMVASRTTLEAAKPLGLRILRLYELLGILDVERDEEGNMVSINNLTLLNLVLVKCKRLTEAQLNNRILLIQVANSLLAFFIRYRLSHLFYY